VNKCVSKRFEGRVAIVTGGATGIGEAVSRQLVEEGARVVIAARRMEPGTALATALGRDRALFHQCDVGVQGEVEALVAATVAAFGGVDILINNAGVACFGPTPELDPAVWHQTIATNLNSVFYACKAAIPHMKKRGGGSIVNNASVSGLFADYGMTAYNASKGAVVNYTKSLAIDHAQDNIRANVVCPGLVDTPMSEVVDQLKLREAWVGTIPLGRAGKPEEIARIIAFVASNEASFMTGSVIVADGGLLAATGQPNLPKLMEKKATAD
jgi:meso-butanediol dehydrogenase/(S,S)-butanediol dehydrogenase/diacetyl reductase